MIHFSIHSLLFNLSCLEDYIGVCCSLFSGGKKKSAIYYDIWNIKYLTKFKWDDLTDEIGTV